MTKYMHVQNRQFMRTECDIPGNFYVYDQRKMKRSSIKQEYVL